MAITKTRTMLIDVARQLFAKLGVENTTMNDIAVASHKGRRTLYTYFNNKNEVFKAVVGSELDKMIKALPPYEPLTNGTESQNYPKKQDIEWKQRQ